jgi:hypothetical protein
MKNSISQTVVSEEIVLQKIYCIQERKVMLDNDLAELYGVPTKALKQAVKRNLKRFPDDFMFILSREEINNLRSQIVTSSWGGSRYLPMAFTEQGVAMLSSILNSDRAIQVNIQIIRIFVKIRTLIQTSQEIIEKLRILENKQGEHDQSISIIFAYLKELEKEKNEEINFKNRRLIGFQSNELKQPL